MVNVVNLFFVVYLIIHNVSGYILEDSNVAVSKGHSVPISAAPYMASLVRFVEEMPNEHEKFIFCGASIVHERFVLTAAHCLENSSYRDIVRVGSNRLRKVGDVYGVEKLISHEKYSKEIVDFDHDIALVKVNKSIVFGSSVVKVVLADETVKIDDGMMVNVTGWRITGIKVHKTRKLRQVSVQINPISECSAYPLKRSKQLCTWTFGKGSCKGDGGSPLTKGNVQLAVESHVVACGSLPSVFVKVAPLLPWINENINNNL